MIRPLDLMEPEEAVGNLWHNWASRRDAAPGAAAAVRLDKVRTSVAALFRALGGDGAAEIVAAPAAATGHRLGRLRRIATPAERGHVADFDGTRLRLPPQIDAFPERDLNRTAYLWLAAIAAFVEMPEPEADPCRADAAALAALAAASERALGACPGLRWAHVAMCAHLLAARPRGGLPAHEAAIEARVCAALGGGAAASLPGRAAPAGYCTHAPVAVWPRLVARVAGPAAADGDEGEAASAPTSLRKTGRREPRDQANRRDSIILHRFESILSWAESLNVNRMTDDDDPDNAQKAADDQDHITLSEHFRRTASRLRVSLDLSPQDAEHERVAGRFTYPEWNHRSRSLMPGHVRVLEAEAAEGVGFAPDPRLVARVRRQFAPLTPRRVRLPRQLDGLDLDLDAAVAAQVAARIDGACDDRLWQASRPVARDLSVAVLLDCSRSTEAAVGGHSVIDVAREALAALAAGIDGAGDRLGIWGFSSLRRDRVFVTRAKGFEEPMSPGVTARIGGLRPGHYTRLGAAIRHASAMLAAETAARRLLLVLTDGKPNDLDHYEGVHGIEDSRMAVREARAAGLAVSAVIVDIDGQDWFARIFGRGGFTLLPDPARLTTALPSIYQTLTMEA